MPVVKTKEDWNKQRLELLKKLSPDKLTWTKVTLRGTVKANGGTVGNGLAKALDYIAQFTNVLEVSAPAQVDGLFVPVDTNETWEWAWRCNAFPLTRAVADQFFKQAAYVDPKPQTDLHDFETYSAYLNRFEYQKGDKAGAHKLWVLSARGRPPKPKTPAEGKATPSAPSAINYGFYVDTTVTAQQKAQMVRTAGSIPGAGRFLAPMVEQAMQQRLANTSLKTTNPHKGHILQGYSVIQQLGATHGANHWDYSQLLQLMRAPKPLVIDGQEMSLAMALAQGEPCVWDEPGRLSNEDLMMTPTPVKK